MALAWRKKMTTTTVTGPSKRNFVSTRQGGSIPSLFKGWRDWKAGDWLTAEYISTKWGDYNGQPTPNHVVKVIECNFQVATKEGPVDPTGLVFTINSAGQINKLLLGDLDNGGSNSPANKGDVITFIYEGKKRGTDPKNKTEYHTFSDLELGSMTEEVGDGL